MSHIRQGKQQEAAPADSAAATVLDNGQLRQEIALRAYYRYCERGCTPGDDREDWLAAEQEVLAQQRAAAGTATTS